MDDFQLLDAWKAGDKQAGDRLIQRHFDSIYRFLAGKVDGDADDLLQRVFTACVTARDQFRKQSSFRTYLFTVARNELHHHYRRLGRQRAQVDLDELSLEDLAAGAPDEGIARTEDQRLLLRALRRLPLAQQTAIELHYWEGLTTAEIAEIQGVPHGTVRSRLSNARRAIDETIRELTGAGSALVATQDDFERWVRSMRGKIAHRR